MRLLNRPRLCGNCGVSGVPLSNGSAQFPGVCECCYEALVREEREARAEREAEQDAEQYGEVQP